MPYCVTNPEVTISELCGRFKVTREEMMEDLNLLFLCGLPEYTPADLIEVAVSDEHVSIRMADYFARPLRLTRSEAIPVYLKAHALLNLLDQGRSGPAELAPLRSAIDKLAGALLPQEGGVAEMTDRIRVHLEAGEAQWLTTLRDAVTERRRVDMEYYTYQRDDLTRRIVDPHLVFASMGHWYLSGYCHLATDRRIFRLDRIKTLDTTAENFEAPDPIAEDLPPPLVYVPGPDDIRVTLRVSPAVAVLFSEYYPLESSAALARGWRRVVLRVSDFAWLEKLLMRLGSDVVIESPPELKAQLKTSADRILKLYGVVSKRSQTASH